MAKKKHISWHELTFPKFFIDAERHKVRQFNWDFDKEALDLSKLRATRISLQNQIDTLVEKIIEKKELLIKACKLENKKAITHFSESISWYEKNKEEKDKELKRINSVIAFLTEEIEMKRSYLKNPEVDWNELLKKCKEGHLGEIISTRVLEIDIRGRFDIENVVVEKENAPLGYHKVEDLEFLLLLGGGDWEIPVAFMLYRDRREYRIYVPKKGNLLDREGKAYVVDEVVPAVMSMFEHDYDALLKDIVARFLGE